MRTPFKSLLIDLLAPTTSVATHLPGNDYLQGDIEWHQYPLLNGDAGFTNLKLHGGGTLHHTRVKFAEQKEAGEWVNYCHVKVDFTEPVLQVHCTLSGQSLRRDLESQQEYLVDEHHAYVCVSADAQFVISVKNDTFTESLHLVVSLSTLSEMLGHDAATQLCLRIQSNPAKTHDLGRSVLSSLRYCLDQSLPFSIRKLRAHARSLEFLSGLAMYFLSERSQTNAEAETLNSTVIRQYIRQHYRECVTLDDLAKAFGVSARTISNILVRETGMPAARLMREKRLAMAHELVQQTDVPLMELADRFGYRHLSNFSHAFKNMFGYSPSTLRQSRQMTRLPILSRFQNPGSSDADD